MINILTAQRSRLVIVFGAASIVQCRRTQFSWAHASQESTPHQPPPLGVSLGHKPGEQLQVMKSRFYEWRLKLLFAMRCLLRFLRHGWVLGPAVASGPAAYLLATRNQLTGELEGIDWWWELLARKVERSGPALLKFLQWASTRRDLFPPGFLRAAARLQDRAEHSDGWGAARRSLDACLQRCPSADGTSADEGSNDQWCWASPSSSSSLGSVFNLDLGGTGSGDAAAAGSSALKGGPATPRCIGSGCVAQVYSGTLRCTHKAAAAQSSSKRRRRLTNDNEDRTHNDKANNEAGTSSATLVEFSSLRKWQQSNLSHHDDADDDAEASLAGQRRSKEEVEGTLLKVAVKVVDRRAAEAIELDLALMACGAHCLEALSSSSTLATNVLDLKWLALSEAVDQFAKVMRAQLDCRLEGENLEQFRANFGIDDIKDYARGGSRPSTSSSTLPWPWVTFPAPLMATHSVLIETLEEGEPVMSIASPSSKGSNKDGDRRDGDGDRLHVQLNKAVAKSGLSAFLRMLFLHNLAHGDLHPGNILIRPRRQGRGHGERRWKCGNGDGDIDTSSSGNSSDNSKSCGDDDDDEGKKQEQEESFVDLLESGGFELVFIDAGIVCQLGPSEAACLVELFAAIVKGDGYGAGRLMIERARRSDCDDPDAFCRGIAKLVDNVFAVGDEDGEGGGGGGASGSGSGLRLSAVQVGRLLGDVLGLCCSHRVLLEARFASVVSAIAVLEGLGRTLDPELDLLKEAAPVVLKAASKRAEVSRALLRSAGVEGRHKVEGAGRAVQEQRGGGGLAK